nr:nodulation protein [Melilotus officinalis]
MIAVKVLHGSSDKRIDQQFMAEVGTIGKVHHFNLVRLYGFCFEKNLIALVYEYMRNGSLDRYLFQEYNILGFEKLQKIAIGTAKGIAYLHEECHQIIIHYDIKPGNILLDTNFNPKVADFGRRRNHDVNLSESQEWFPMWVWKKFDAEQVNELVTACRIEEKNMEIVERMVKVALSCVQYRPESRPTMSVVVQMLEGLIEIPKPLNPFQYMIDGTFSSLPVPISQINTDTTIGSGSSVMVTESSVEGVTPVMTKYQVELASV